MENQESPKAVIAAVFVNLAISILKLAAFAVSGSGAMLAEGIHSIADTMNQALLWLGINRSKRPPDRSHPYGYGAERYFWALISALGIFVLGCGLTCYHGVTQLLNPTMPIVNWIVWVVLGIAGVLEGFVFLIAFSQANKQRKGTPWSVFLKTSTDPTLIAVLFEDAVAVLGVLVAAIGIGLSHITGMPIFDGIASILIGLLLGALALTLAIKNKNLLVGQAAAGSVEDQIRQIVSSNPAIDRIIGLRTRILAAGQHRVDLQVDFDPQILVDRMVTEIHDSYASLKTSKDLEMYMRKFADRIVDDLAAEVDRLEEEIRREIPSAQLIDIEGDA
jgi:solute carrier family 30 (zinc transporter), member 9